MDPRVREHAEIIVEHSVDLRAGDDVVISTPPVAEDLGVALHEAAGDVGANPVYLFKSDRAERAYLRAGGEDFETPDHELALVETADAAIRVLGDRNATEQTTWPRDDLGVRQGVQAGQGGDAGRPVVSDPPATPSSRR